MKSTVAIALTATLLLSGCGSKKEDKPADQSNAPAHQKKAFIVEVSPVKTQDVVYTITAVGSLEAIDEIKIPARLNGTAESVNFNEGNRVDQDTILLEIEPKIYSLQAKQAEATYEKTIAILHEAQSAFDKRAALKKIDAGWVSDEEIASYTAQVETATAGVYEAKAAWDLAEQNKTYSHVRPPTNGIINTKFVTTGQYLRPEQIVATMVDMSKLRLRFKVSEIESTKLDKNAICNFKTNPLPQKQFTATIYHVNQTADPTTRMVECLAWVDNPGEILKPGFFAEVTIGAETHKKAVVVPSEAVLPTEKGFVTFVVERDIAKEREVQLVSNTKDGKVEILSGLREEDNLVIKSAEILRDGYQVKPGSFTKITINTEMLKKAIVVPNEAVLPKGKGFIAFVLEDIAKECVVQLGLNTKDGKVEILSGLKEGESLVIKGAEVLRDGYNVKIVE